MKPYLKLNSRNKARVIDVDAFVADWLATDLCIGTFCDLINVNYNSFCQSKAWKEHPNRVQLQEEVHKRQNAHNSAFVKEQHALGVGIGSAETRERMSASQKIAQMRPDVRARKSKATTEYFESHPEAREYLRELATKQFATEESRRAHGQRCSAGWTAERRTRQSKVLASYYAVPEHREEQSLIQTQYSKNHPEKGAKHSAFMRTHYEQFPVTLETRTKISQSLTAYYKEHSVPTDTCKKISQGKKRSYTDHPEIKEAQSARAKYMYATHTGWASKEGRHNRHVALGKAGHQGSKPQNDLAEELKTYGLNVVNGTDLNWELLDDEDKELDIFFPDHSLAIEVNGEAFHYTPYNENYQFGKGKGVDKNYHLNKTLCAQQNGIRLLHFWAHTEVEQRHNQVLNKILSLTGKLERQRVYARKTIVRKVDAIEVKEFLNTFHIQGYMHSIYYALYSNDGLLLACMGFKKHASNTADGKESTNSYDLTRYCTHPDYFVVGGYEKLEKAMVRDLDPDYITSIADRRISTGALYEHQGFYKVAELAPDYMYFYKGVLHHKFNFRLKRFKEDPELQYEEGLTEAQLAELNNIPRCYDCGKIKYRKDFR